MWHWIVALGRSIFLIIRYLWRFLTRFHGAQHLPRVENILPTPKLIEQPNDEQPSTSGIVFRKKSETSIEPQSKIILERVSDVQVGAEVSPATRPRRQRRRPYVSALPYSKHQRSKAQQKDFDEGNTTETSSFELPGQSETAFNTSDDCDSNVFVEIYNIPEYFHDVAGPSHVQDTCNVLEYFDALEQLDPVESPNNEESPKDKDN